MIGESLGQYRIEAQIGAGAMGVVYRAFDTRLNRLVAIKRLQEIAPALASTRLLDEARAAATLNHPNICTIHEVATIDGHTFIVMEFVDGSPLSDLIPAHGLPFETVLDFGRQISDAMAFAHARGVVHRDLKTSNIVITREGRPKVLDFGLARRVPATHADEFSLPAATVSLPHGDIAGTPAYMSPEALRGASSTPRSDVWSLGIVLYEMATGQRPYTERTAIEVAARVLSDAPVDLPSTLPPQLAAVIKRCLAKEPERRYLQAGEVRAALEAVHDSSSTMFGGKPAAGAAQRRRSMVIVAAVTAAMVVLVLGFQPARHFLDRIVAEPAIAFAERDWLIIGDFDNQTGNPVFDRSLNTALSASISQSSYVNIVPSSRVRESLRRMQRPNVSAADAAAAREVAIREGFRLVLAPAITSAGSSFTLTASLIEPTSGASLRSEVVQAASKDDVLGALDELSNRIRRALGEASATVVQQSKPLAQVTTASLEALQRFSHGREAHIAQQFDTARALYEEALQLDPTFTAARATLGMINFEFFDRAKGVELLSQAVKGIDGLTDSERLSVQTFHAMAVEQNPDKAAAHIKAFLAIHPDVASAHNNLGRVYMQLRRFNEAVTELQAATRLDPDLFLAYYSLHSIYLYELGDVESAIATAERQIARNESAGVGHGLAGAGYAAAGDWRQAEIALRKALELEPDPRFVHDRYRLGHVLRLQGRLEEARQIFVEILKLAPGDTSAKYEAGAISQLLNDADAARTYLRAVVDEAGRHLTKQPRDGVRALELAAALARLGNAGRARTIAAQNEPLTGGLPVERAGLQVLLGEREGALVTLERAVDAGYRNVLWARINSDMHALQGDARYEAILSRMRQRP